MTFHHETIEFQEKGYCILPKLFKHPLIDACRNFFWPILSERLKEQDTNRGTNRYFLPMPFESPCFAPEFFFNSKILEIVRTLLGDRIVADQWGCDVPVLGSEYQKVHVDYQRPLFNESPDLQLPAYMLVVSFSLVDISSENGPIEIAAGSHLMKQQVAHRAIENGEIEMKSIPLQVGDVLIRHPWALHRGTPNKTDIPRPLISIRYVRQWYTDQSRDVNSIPHAVWKTLTTEQQAMMRFPVLV